MLGKLNGLCFLGNRMVWFILFGKFLIILIIKVFFGYKSVLGFKKFFRIDVKFYESFFLKWLVL